jgi:DNA-binding NarL/FixJ family response regulator
MEQTHVVILSSQSLFAEGIASRLLQYLQLVELEIIAPWHLDAMSRIIAARPSVVILDDTAPGIAQYCSLDKLLRLLPKLKVILLDLQQEQIQVVDSEQCLATGLSDLAKMIHESA